LGDSSAAAFFCQYFNKKLNFFTKFYHITDHLAFAIFVSYFVACSLSGWSAAAISCVVRYYYDDDYYFFLTIGGYIPEGV